MARSTMVGPFVLLLLLLFATACVRNNDIRVYPTACPSGWRFLYTEYRFEGSAATERAVVCKRGMADTAIVRPFR